MAKTVRVSEITAKVREILDPEGRRNIVWDAKIGRYIVGGSGAVPAFAHELNVSPQFQPYGLDLHPHDLSSVKHVRELIGVIADWLKSRGWTVSL